MIFFCFVFCYLALGRNFHSSVSLSGSFHHQAADWLSWFCPLLWLVSLFYVLAADWSDSKFVRPIKFSRLHLKISKKLYFRISPFLRLIFDCESLFQKLRFWFEYSLECGVVFQLAEVLLQDQQENIPSLPRIFLSMDFLFVLWCCTSFTLVSLIPDRPAAVLRIPVPCPNQNKTKISGHNSADNFALKNDLKETIDLNEPALKFSEIFWSFKRSQRAIERNQQLNKLFTLCIGSDGDSPC